MTGDGPSRDQTELDRLAEDWITLWQSEIAALAGDREAAESWAGAVASWAALMAAWARAATTPPFGHGQAGFPSPFAMPPQPWPPGWPAAARPHDGAAPPPGPAPAAPASPADREPGYGGDREPGDAALRARLAELERRLADLEGGAGGSAPDRRRPRRRKPAP